MIRPKTRSSGSCLPNLGKDEISSLLGSHFLPSFPCPWPGACTRSGFVCLFWLKSHHTHSPCMGGATTKVPFSFASRFCIGWRTPRVLPHVGAQLGYRTSPLFLSLRCFVATSSAPIPLGRRTHVHASCVHTYMTSWLARQWVMKKSRLEELGKRWVMHERKIYIKLLLQFDERHVALRCHLLFFWGLSSFCYCLHPPPWRILLLFIFFIAIMAQQE